MKKRIGILLLTTAGIGVVGCKTENTYEREKPTYQANSIKTNKVETDPFLADKAHVLDIRTAIVQSDLLKVDVELVSDRLWAGNFDYKFEWFDDQGMPVESLMST